MESGVNHIFAVEYVVRDFANTEINPHTDARRFGCLHVKSEITAMSISPNIINDF